MTTLRGAVVGCGMIAEYHLRAWQRIPEVEIVALCDPDHTRAESRRADFAPKAQLYDSLTAALSAEQLDFVDILSPPWLHREHCLAAASASLHIICQKPLCNQLTEAQALVSELAGYQKTFSVHENHPYRPWFRHILKLNAEGFFGTIRHVSLVQHDAREPPEKFKAEAERGVMLEYGVHLVDMLRKLLGNPDQISASFQRVNPRVRGESLATAVFRCREGNGLIDISWKATGPELGSATVIGDRGLAQYDGRMTRGQHSRFRLYQEGQLVLDEQRCPTDDFVDSFYLLQRDLTDAMLNGTSAPQPATDNFQTLATTFLAYEATGWR